MSVLMLPEPEGWRSGGRRVVWAIVGGLVLLAWFLYCGIVATLRGHYLTTAVVAGVSAPALAMYAACAILFFGRIHLHANVDASGLEILPDRRFAPLIVAGFVAFIPGGVLFVVFVPQGMIDLPMTRGMQLFSPAAIGFALLFAVIGVVAAIRRRGIGYLNFDPVGIEVVNIISTKFIDWDDIAQIRGHSETQKKTRKAVVLCLRDGGEEVVDGLDLYVAGGAPLYWMVRHYWCHPDDRAELTDGRAVSRLKESRFEVA